MFQTRSDKLQICLDQISFLTQFIDINVKFGEVFMNKFLSKLSLLEESAPRYTVFEEFLTPLPPASLMRPN